MLWPRCGMSVLVIDLAQAATRRKTSEGSGTGLAPLRNLRKFWFRQITIVLQISAIYIIVFTQSCLILRFMNSNRLYRNFVR